jgi:hypothetical protein
MPEHEVTIADQQFDLIQSGVKQAAEKIAMRAVLSYGKLNAEERKILREGTDGQCEICDQKTEKLCVDHDHDTDQVRGIVCYRCNMMLGWVDGLSLHWLEKADKYLLNSLSEIGGDFLLSIARRNYRQKRNLWVDELNQLDEHRQKLLEQLDKAEKRIGNIVKQIPYEPSRFANG